MAKISRRSVASNSAPSLTSSSSSSTSGSSNANSISHSRKSASLHSSFSQSHSLSGLAASATASPSESDSNRRSGSDPLRENGTLFTTAYAIPKSGHYDGNDNRIEHAAAAASPSIRSVSSNGNNPTQQFSTTARPKTPTDITAATVMPSPPSLSLQNKTTPAQIIAAERERVRMEFFATYDVMTGVRIAATLGGFFGLMVFLIVWKSRSSSNETLRVLKDPKIAAVAAACMQEEEDRKIQEAMEATGMSIYPDEYDTILYRRQRMLSLGNVSAPPVLHRGFRFSSVGGGGYSSLLEPPRRFSYSAGGCGSGGGGRRQSCSESSRILSNYPIGSSFGTDDYFMETDDDDLNNGECDNGEPVSQNGRRARRASSTRRHNGFLEVPPAGQDSRRSSAMTCCSTESSYLERRCSVITLGLGGNLPSSLRRKLSTASRTSSTDIWDYYYPDIQVIQPTPKTSPCPSERSIYDQLPKIPQAPSSAPVQQQPRPPPKTLKQRSPANYNYGAAAAPQQFVRKHSIAYYDPESAQAGRKQQIHSISADPVELFYQQASVTRGENGGVGVPLPQPITSPVGIHYCKEGSATDAGDAAEELRLNVKRKIAVVELQSARNGFKKNNNNSFPYSNSAAAVAAAAAARSSTGSSSFSVDSNVDVCGGAKPSITGKRAPLASLSSFKISSLDCQDSEMRSLDEDSVFFDSVADTDEDMEQFSTDSDEVSLDDDDCAMQLDDSIKSAPLPHPDVKKLSTVGRGAGGGGSRPRRPVLERHRTITAFSDRISLIGQQMKDFPLNYKSNNSNSAKNQQQQSADREPPPLETHFGIIVQAASSGSSLSPAHFKRAHLQQQISDPQSLPTTTEEDTCSTMNTEICAAAGQVKQLSNSNNEAIVSFSRYNALPISHTKLDNNNEGSLTESQTIHSMITFPKSKLKHQMPRSKLADDEPTPSSVSDSVAMGVRQPIICVPSSLKNLIRGSPSATASAVLPAISKSVTNLCVNDSQCPNSVILELPLIKLPTDESFDTESPPDDDDDDDQSPSKSDDSRDPSLPGASRKWSKETLF